MVAQSPEFTAAAEQVKQLEKSPSSSQLLELYALYKIGTDAPEPTKPGMFDKFSPTSQKHGAWKKLHDEKVTPEEAQKRYVALVEELKASLGYSG